jgi:hypothetical protein
MDTGTVLSIIKMINQQRQLAKETLKTIPKHNQDEVQYWNGRLDSYFGLNQHLQGFIEAQVNAMENQSPEQ